MAIFTFANSTSILPEYCVEKNAYLSTFTNDKNHTKLFLKLPSSMSYKITSLKVQAFLKENNIPFTDKSGGIVEFRKFCNIDKKIPFLYLALKKKFQNNHPSISIKSLKIFPKSPIPNNFNLLKFEKISISNISLRNKTGNFKAFFKLKNTEKIINFGFEIDARVTIYKANKDLKRGKKINLNDFSKSIVKLENLPNNLIKNDKIMDKITKQNIKESQILCEHHFKKQFLVFKNSIVDAVAKDGSMTLLVQVRAMNGGDKGDVIKVKTKEGKILFAEILSKNKVGLR